MTVYDDTLSDSVTVSQSVVDIVPVLAAAADSVTVSQSMVDIVPVLAAAADSLAMEDTHIALLSELATVVETVLVTPELIPYENVRLYDQVDLADTFAPAALFAKLMSESVQIAQRMAAGFVTSIEEQATIEATIAMAHGWTVAEQLNLTDTLSALATYGVTTAESIRLQATLARFLGGDIAETVQLAPTVVANSMLRQGVAEVVLFDDVVTPKLLLHVAVDESLEFDDTDLLQLIYSGKLQDGVAIEAMHLGPAGGVVTWCVNTRMGYVTQYKDYDFNSFAVVGGKYVGATSEGLYELHGDTDDGAQIIAGITGGILQMNSSKLHGLKGVYLGLRGTGEFYLKLTSGDGQEYVYRVTARDMETTKVNIGKGLRHRYLSYGLESVGQDFELETVEFVPMRAFRRV